MSDVEFTLSIKLNVDDNGDSIVVCPRCNREIRVNSNNIRTIVMNTTTNRIECSLKEPYETCPYELIKLYYVLLPFSAPFKYTSSNPRDDQQDIFDKISFGYKEKEPSIKPIEKPTLQSMEKPTLQPTNNYTESPINRSSGHLIWPLYQPPSLLPWSMYQLNESLDLNSTRPFIQDIIDKISFGGRESSIRLSNYYTEQQTNKLPEPIPWPMYPWSMYQLSDSLEFKSTLADELKVESILGEINFKATNKELSKK